MLRVRRSRVPIRRSQPLDPTDIAQDLRYSRDPPRIQGRIRARTLTRLAINLFALLNVILFYCWIKRTGNLMFLCLVHVTSPGNVSHVIEGRDYFPSVSAGTPRAHRHI